jgi:hypothetical protein
MGVVMQLAVIGDNSFGPTILVFRSSSAERHIIGMEKAVIPTDPNGLPKNSVRFA